MILSSERSWIIEAYRNYNKRRKEKAKTHEPATPSEPFLIIESL